MVRLIIILIIIIYGNNNIIHYVVMIIAIVSCCLGFTPRIIYYVTNISPSIYCLPKLVFVHPLCVIVAHALVAHGSVVQRLVTQCAPPLVILTTEHLTAHATTSTDTVITTWSRETNTRLLHRTSSVVEVCLNSTFMRLVGMRQAFNNAINHV